MARSTLLPRAPTPGSQLRDLCTDAIGRDVLSSQVGGIAKKCVFTTVGNGTFRLRAVQQNGSSEGVRVSVRSAKAVASVHISPKCEPGSQPRALEAPKGDAKGDATGRRQRGTFPFGTVGLFSRGVVARGPIPVPWDQPRRPSLPRPSRQAIFMPTRNREGGGPSRGPQPGEEE